MIFATFSVIENSESANKNIWFLPKRPYLLYKSTDYCPKGQIKFGIFYAPKSPPLRKTICKLNTCIIIYIIGSDKIILNESGDPF